MLTRWHFILSEHVFCFLLEFKIQWKQAVFLFFGGFFLQ